MNINRYNYEEFFLLYVDNELTKAERGEVEAFVDNNPDLQEELAMLRQSKLRPDAAVQFIGKDLLLKPESASIVNETNYEEFFLLYVDDELNAVERREVEEFAATTPQFRQELNLLLQTKVQPEHEVVFPDKSLLYKESEKERPVIFLWRRVVAVAAMLLLALGVLWISNRRKAQDNFAQTEPKKEQQQKSLPVVKEEQQQQLAVQEKKDKPAVNSTTRRYNEPVDKKQDVAVRNDNEPKSNNTVEIIDRAVDAVQIAAANNNAASNNSTGLNVNAVGSTQSLAQTVAYTQPQELEDENVYIANTSVDKKNKLRGLFRKVSRVFEKTTNLPAVEEKGILIGNLEIALK